MPGFVDGQFSAVREADRGQEPPALIGYVSCHFDSLVPQFGERGVDVVTHQVKLMVAVTVDRMNGKLGRGKAKMSQPPPASADARPNTSAKNARTFSAAGENTIA